VKCQLCGEDLGPETEACPACSRAATQERLRAVVQETIQVLSTRTATDVEPAKLFFIIGNFYRLSGRYAEAIHYYEKAVSLPDAKPEYHRSLGTALAANGDYRGAIMVLKRAVELAPSYPDFHNDLGAAYFKDGRYELAVQEFETAIRINPRYANAHNNLGLAFRKKGLYQEAESQIKVATELDPEHAIATYELGLSYYSGGMFSQLRRSAMLDARALGDIYYLREMYAEAVEQYEKAVKMHPGYADYQCALGKAYAAVGRAEDARGALEAALRINPRYEEARAAYEALKRGEIPRG
jgi:tetratricopeptide (TPR) repeat protein